MITSTIFGFFLTIVGINETTVTGYKVVTTLNKAGNTKQESQLKASLHEEVQQILKDAIKEAGE
jgi:hypothetical protein